MQVKLTSAATLPEVLKNLGVAPDKLDAVAAQVARTAKLDVTKPVPAGRTLDIADDLFVLHAPAPTPAPQQKAQPLSKALGALGLFGVQQSHDARTGQNDLGALSSLSAVQLLGLVDKAALSVRVPLKPGVHAIPLGDKRVLVDVPPGTVLTLSAAVKGTSLSGAELAFSKSVALENPADLSFADKSFLGDVANALVKVKLDGVSVSADGSVTPKGTVSRPSMNLFKHVFSTGRSENALETLVSLAGKPRIATSLEALAKGDVLKDKTAFAANDIPSRFDIGNLLESIGAVADGGSFSLRVDGRQGFVDVGKGRVQVVGADQKLSCTVTGNFKVAGGAVDVDAQAKTTGLHVPVRVRFDERGAPGAQVGPLAVATGKDGAMEVSVGGSLLAAVHALADRFHVAIPDDVALTFDGQSLVSGHARISAKDGGVVVEHGDIKAVVDAAGSRAKADTLDVTLGAGSTIELSASGISVKDGDLVVDNAAAGFSATAVGTAKNGMLGVAVDGAGAQGKLSVDLSAGSADGAVTWAVKAKPRLGFVPLPGKADVAGGASVVLTRDAVAWQSSNRLRLSL